MALLQFFFDPTTRLPVASIEYPPDFRDETGYPIAREVLPFVLVAYDLSQFGLAIPEVSTPHEVPPLPPMR